MHEHINHFSEEGLRRLLTGCGFIIEHISTAEIDLGWTTGSFLSCLAR
jgi:hypothetical protein